MKEHPQASSGYFGGWEKAVITITRDRDRLPKKVIFRRITANSPPIEGESDVIDKQMPGSGGEHRDPGWLFHQWRLQGDIRLSG